MVREQFFLPSHGLARLWFVGDGALYLQLMTQLILKNTRDNLQQVWSYFVPT